MKINRNNYEVWFLDYYEGRLTPEQVKELMEFLYLHYDLKQEFESFENVSIPQAKKVVFDGKELLKKKIIVSVGNINESNYTDLFIAYHENDLSEEEKNNVLLFVEKNPSLKKDFELFSKTRVAADTSLKFDAKQNLKKSKIVTAGSINEMNYEESFIASMEGELTLQQHSELKNFLNANPHLRRDYELFGQTKLEADTTIAFEGKEQLKKKFIAQKKTQVRYLYYAVSVAASLLILFTVYSLLNRNSLQKIETAYRNNFEWQKNNTPEQKQNNSSDLFASNVLPQNNSNTVLPVSKKKTEDIYIQALNTGLVRDNNTNTPEEISKSTVFEDFYAMMQRKRMEAEKQNETRKDEGFMSLKDFALFKTKKAMAPEDQKDKVTPTGKITGWDLAEAGVNQVNRLTGADAKLTRGKDNKGFRFTLGDNFELASNR